MPTNRKKRFFGGPLRFMRLKRLNPGAYAPEYGFNRFSSNSRRGGCLKHKNSPRGRRGLMAAVETARMCKKSLTGGCGCAPEIDPDWRILARIAHRHVCAFGRTGQAVHARDAAALLFAAARLAEDELVIKSTAPMGQTGGFNESDF